jgi:prevent-host-death family protein
MATVSVRVLKDELSEYLRRAEAGERVLVTRDGKPIAVLSSVSDAALGEDDAALTRLVNAGLLSRVPAPLGPLGAPVELGPGTALSEIVREDRR